MDEDGRPGRRGFKERMSNAAGALLRAAASAGELLVDPSLRRRGAAMIMDEASKGIQGIQRGLEESANTVAELGVKRVQSVLKDIERKVSHFQRQASIMGPSGRGGDAGAGYEFLRRTPMDIQMGGQVYEDMPSEMRSRLYYVLSMRTDLADGLMDSIAAACGPEAGGPRHVKRPSRLPDGDAAAAAAGEGGSGGDGGGGSEAEPGEQQRRADSGGGSAAGREGSCGAGDLQHEWRNPSVPVFHLSHLRVLRGASGGAEGWLEEGEGEGKGEGEGEAAGAEAAGTEPAAAAAAARGAEAPEAADGAAEEAAAAEGAAAAPSASGAAADGAGAGDAAGDAAGGAQAASSGGSSSGSGSSGGSGSRGGTEWSSPLAPRPWPEDAPPSAPDPWNSSSAPATEAAADAAAAALAASPPSTPFAAAALADADAHAEADAAAGPVGGGGGGAAGGPRAGARARSAGSDEWEVLTRSAVGGAVGDSGAVEAVETVRTLAQSLAECAPLDPAAASQAALFEAMLAVPWAPGAGIPDAASPSPRYGRLISAPPGGLLQRCMGGVEAVDDVIARDLGRTFPEHPLFVAGEGQARLGRLLRAYALHDEEVGYCQGQAFAAGMLLMYVPEEVAFNLYCRLMDDPPAGAGLRRLYQPGLEPLKLELSRFELLLASHLPALHAHLHAAGLPPVLYASQWFMTLFASPFPLHFGGRILDVLLQGRDGAVLPRVGLALMEALQGELLALDDFEAIITAVKVTPLQWPVHVYRRVLDRALSAAFLRDADLAAAQAAAAAEAARLGRPSSFSARRLMRTHTEGGSERVELTPLAEGGDEAGAGGGAPGGGGAAAAARSGSAGSAGAGGLAGASSGAAHGGGRGGSVGGPLPDLSELAELDLELESILHDLHLILPGSGSDDDEGGGEEPAGGGGGGAEPAAAAAAAAHQ
ncbi:MAG: rab-GTPase-TBC domain-containing protein [Monoraphidium minutum]|nr:MAG: rab-GTPase-TBC domain-containing protein [Monoraphidium minutum]